MKKYIFPLIMGLVLFAPHTHASNSSDAGAYGNILKAVASSVEPANLSTGPAAKKAKPKPTTKKKITKTPTKKSTAPKSAKPKSKTSSSAKLKTTKPISTNTTDVQRADLLGQGTTAQNLSPDQQGQDPDGDGIPDVNAALQQNPSPDSQTPAEVKPGPEINLPEPEQPAKSSGKGLAIAGLSGLSGLGLMLLLKRIFFH